ncbi:glycosyltransferase family 2 protein [Alphaproteobacteria bacterium]|nr:glycosyltransferase family 2 protein [Alphaproteobacteria bacterium]
MYKFNNYSISIILPVINETYSLEETVEVILKENDSIQEILIITSKNKTTKKSFETIKILQAKYSNIIIHFHQELPFIGGAIIKGFQVCNGSHVIMMASDLETNPEDVKKMIILSKKNLNSLITASRWKNFKSFKNYNLLKLLLNFIFQNLMKLFFMSKLTDMTYGYRLFPSKLVKSLSWQELKHPFLLETILLPLKINIDIIEIESKWKSRSEGESQNSFFANFMYFKTAFRIKFLVNKKSVFVKK